MFNKFKEIKNSENSVTTSSVRKQSSSMRFYPNKETASKFWDQFENTLKLFESLPDAQALSENEKQDVF